jgi:capsular polysaccharide biosynthesis protein
VNQAEVVELLNRYGFRAVCLEQLTIPQQVNLFRHVRNLVSVHGAGMANMIFMEPGGAVIDLINEHHRDASFFNLACAAGHRQVVLQCVTVGNIHRKAAIYDMAADISRLKHYLEQCLV